VDPGHVSLSDEVLNSRSSFVGIERIFGAARHDRLVDTVRYEFVVNKASTLVRE
jgi:hypothetical protein